MPPTETTEPMRTLLDDFDLRNPKKPGSVPPRLSKSRLVDALQCDRKLWLSVHRTDLTVIDAATQATFDTGYRVGEVAREVATMHREQGELIDAAEPGVGK